MLSLLYTVYKEFIITNLFIGLNYVCAYREQVKDVGGKLQGYIDKKQYLHATQLFVSSCKQHHLNALHQLSCDI